MKKRIAILALAPALMLAETWTGTVVDVACKNKDLPGHTRDCALRCSRTGYGIVLPDGKFLKFDEQGNTKALAALKASNKEKDLKVKVNGAIKDDVLEVESIQLQ